MSRRFTEDDCDSTFTIKYGDDDSVKCPAISLGAANAKLEEWEAECERVYGYEHKHGSSWHDDPEAKNEGNLTALLWDVEKIKK